MESLEVNFWGVFDGLAFNGNNPDSLFNAVDYGMDNYTGISFSGVPDRRILKG